MIPSNPPPDAINPAHYQGPIECIDALESLGCGVDFCRGNAIKYLWRLGKKDAALQDAQKAQWYVNRLVRQLEAGQQLKTVQQLEAGQQIKTDY